MNKNKDEEILAQNLDGLTETTESMNNKITCNSQLMTVHDLHDRISVSPEVYVRQVQPNRTYESIINQAKAEAQIKAVQNGPMIPYGVAARAWESGDQLEYLYQMKFRNRFERWVAKKLLKWKHGIEVK